MYICSILQPSPCGSNDAGSLDVNKQLLRFVGIPSIDGWPAFTVHRSPGRGSQHGEENGDLMEENGDLAVKNMKN